MHFYNPHSSDFLGIPLSFTIIRKKPLLKYAYLLKASTNAKYIFDFKESSIFKKKIIKKYFYFFIPIIFLEIILWCSYNEISFRKVKFILKKQKKNFKLFIMSYKSMTDVDNSTFEFFNSYSHIYIHLTHYFIRTKEKAKNISKIKAPITLLGDSDFKNNSYFKKYFKKKNLQFEILPFKPHDRFKIKKNIIRINRLYSGGTVHKLNLERPKKYYSDFRNFFKVNSYHTIRPYLSNCSIDFLDNAHGAWSEQTKLIGGNAYFKSDLCDIFNRYVAVIYGSELSGAPSISNLEAICCGSIALMDRKYIKGLPLIEGVDFVHVNEHEKNLEKEIKKKFNLVKKMYTKKNRKLDFKKRYNFFLKKKLMKLNVQDN